MKLKCSKCNNEIEIDCPSCGSWTCPDCGTVNTIQVEEAEGEDWLDKDGICQFPGAVQKMPDGIWIGSGFTDIMELVVGIVYNKPGPGFEVFDWDKTQEIPDEILDRVIGLKMDTETINYIQKKYNGRGILLGESDGDIQDMGLTPAEWKKKYGSSGVPELAEQRLFWYARGGGVQVHRPAGTKKFGVHATKPAGAGTQTTDLGSGKKPVKLGKY